MDTTDENRQRLINIASGTPLRYCVQYCVDVKGNITILGGDELPDAAHDFMLHTSTEDYIHLYDHGRKGGDFINKEHEAAKNIKRKDIVQAYLAFRQQHPHDGYGVMAIMDDEPENPDKRVMRDDIDEVMTELKRRNRQYIAELYGETLPVDYDFKQHYEDKL